MAERRIRRLPHLLSDGLLQGSDVSFIPSDRSRPIDRKLLLSNTFLASLEHHKTLGSTNDRAKVLAREGAANLPVLVVTDLQTAGRGRGVNRWWSGPGSLAFSLLVDTASWNAIRERISLTALAAGIAVVEVLSPQLSRHEAGLHWPNDIYVGNRKLGGILIEVPAVDRLIVGVGVNTNCRLADAPAELQKHIATLIDLTDDVHDHTGFLVDWLNGWESWISRLPARAEEIGDRADQLCRQRGKLLRVRQGNELHEGRCLGIAPDGAIRLQTDHGVRQFYSGTLE